MILLCKIKYLKNNSNNNKDLNINKKFKGFNHVNLLLYKLSKEQE